ncbi:MAG: histidinol-phosphate transaminase, partial [Terracidiphilus sp.]
MPDFVTAVQPTPRARVQAMKEYHPPLGSRDALRLDFNENTLACSPKVREALARISTGQLTRYPEREPVEAIVADELCLDASHVALTNGVDEAIHVLFETFLEAGDELLLPVPTYTMYEVYASATDTTVVPVLAADDLQFPFERLLAGITPRTKIIAIANPNSPSGTVAARAQLIELTRRAPHAVVLVDEAYFHFYGETVIDLIDKIPNLIVARTFSKAYGLAGLRLGLLAGPVELVRWIRRVLSPYSVNSLALACLPPALEDRDYLNWYVGEVLSARADFEAAMDAAGLRRWPSRANFILIDVGPQHAEFVRL